MKTFTSAEFLKSWTTNDGTTLIMDNIFIYHFSLFTPNSSDCLKHFSNYNHFFMVNMHLIILYILGLFLINFQFPGGHHKEVY